MAFEKKTFLTARKRLLEKSEFNVECNISAGVSCGKILAISAQVCVQGQEVVDKIITYSGIIDIKAVFTNEEGEIISINSSCPFSSKFESDEISSSACAFVKVDVIDYTSEIVGSDSIRVNVVLSQSGFVVNNNSNYSLYCDDEDVCYQNEDVEIVKFVDCAKDSFVSESDVNLRENIKKILLVESNAIVKSVEAGANYVAASGDVISRVLYLTENDKFESGYIHDTFKQEVELAGSTRDSLAEGYVGICQEGVACDIVQDEKGGKLVIKVPINLSVFAYEKGVTSVIKDLYSVKANVNIAMNSYEMSDMCGIELIEGKIEGSLTLDDEKPRVDKLLFSGGNKVSIINHYINEGELFVEGIAQTTVVYLNDDTSSLYSVVLDVPFVISDKIKCPSDSMLSLSAVITDADVVVKKGRELIYDAKVKVGVNCCRSINGAIISDAVFAEEFDKKDCAMEVIFAPKGKDLWDIAKSAHVQEGLIRLQNPDVTFPVEKDTPLILFYQRKSDRENN